MTQMQPTGKDPRFVKGQPFDIPDGDAVTLEKMEEEGTAEPVDLIGQTGPPNHERRVAEIANANIRSDAMSHPQDRAIAGLLEDDREEEVAAHNTEAVVTRAEANAAKKAAAEHPPHHGDAVNNRVRTSSAASRRHDKAAKGGEGKSADTK